LSKRDQAIAIEELPPVAARASLALRDELLAILGDDLIGMWLHGGTTFADRSGVSGDLDIAVVIDGLTPAERTPGIWQADPTSRPSRIRAAQATLAERSGVDLDTTYLALEEVRGGRLPRRAFRHSERENGWALARAHWLGGQYVPLHGRRPEELIVAPTERELRWALDRELEHLERHVAEGDASDPYEATYAILNGCRILRTLETGDAVISKRSAGDWGLANLPSTWHDAIRAARRSYHGEASTEDIELLRRSMPEFIAYVREHLPAPPSRRAARPRWS
jgi:hypothetical protein